MVPFYGAAASSLRRFIGRKVARSTESANQVARRFHSDFSTFADLLKTLMNSRPPEETATLSEWVETSVVTFCC